MIFFNRIKYYSLLGFAFFMPISQRISTIMILILVAISLITIRKNDIILSKQFLTLPVIYFFYCFSLFYSYEFQVGIIEQKASLIAFPLIFIINKRFNQYFYLILKYFIVGCVVALLICELNAFYQSFNNDSRVFHSMSVKNLTLYNSIINNENYFFAKKFSFIHQTVYFSMYLSFAIIILLCKKIFKKSIQVLIFFLLVIGVFQVLNKASLLVLIFVCIMRVFALFKRKRTTLIITMSFLLISVCVFLLNPRIKKFNTNFKINESEIKIQDFKKIPNNTPTNTNTRILLWSSALELIKDNKFFGIGAGGSHKKLYEHYAVKRQWYDKSVKFHAHNQFIQVLLDIGFVGFIPFISIFVFMIRIGFINYDESLKTIILSFIFICGINFLFESMFERYSGISFFSFFFSLIMSVSIKTGNKTTRNQLFFKPFGNTPQ